MAHVGLPAGDFWPLSPRTFVAILDQLMARRQAVAARADLRCGLLASLLYNPHRRKGAPALGVLDFFPALKGLVEEDDAAEDFDLDALMAYAKSVGVRSDDADT